MKIEKEKLLNILKLLSDRINENFGDQIILDSKDYYWQISLDEMYNILHEPQHLTIGQISDDWLELKRLLKENEDAISYDLLRLAELLKILKYCSSGVW